ncbi:MAG: thioesterase [Acidobacteria bacterium]|nr:thioesterase [Acidobacteriota bacterium]
MKCDTANPKASGPVDVWQETFPVRFGSIDKSDRLTLDAVFRFFQEAAISHAENLGVGLQDLARTGQVWIISRMSAIVNRRPKYCETVTVRSWPRGAEKLFAMRDYDIRDKDGIASVSARSCWIIVDIEKRRPLRPQPVMESLPKNENMEALSWSPAGLEERGNLQKTAERKALYTDLDYIGHVNNVRYIQWIEDTLDPRLLEKAEKMRLDINYLNEILGGEVIEIMSAPLEDEGCSGAFAFEGRKAGNGQAAFRAELRLWE